MQSQTKIFSRLVKDYAQTDPLIVPPDESVEKVLGKMIAGRATCVLVAGDQAGLVGIFTEKDALRRVALRCTGDEPISAVMTSPVQSVLAEDYLYHAIARMRRFGHRHMPVVDREGRPAGILDLHDASHRRAGRRPLAQRCRCRKTPQRCLRSTRCASLATPRRSVRST